MRSDETLTLLERENPVREDDLPGPASSDARVLRASIARERFPDPRRRRHPRTVVLRVAVVAAAASAIAFAVVSLQPG
jgi:hypothetical protein